MTYITMLKNTQTQFQTVAGIEYLQAFLNQTNPTPPVFTSPTSTFFETHTVLSRNRYRNGFAIHEQKQSLIFLAQLIDNFKTQFDTRNMSAHYDTFFIPKSSGGMRQINAPKIYLKSLMYNIKDVFENKLHVLYHNNAYAYVKGRSTKLALECHQKNNSRWFLKIDLKDFFPSCNLNLLRSQLSRIYPFSEHFRDAESAAILHEILQLCLLEGGLPQGTPLSPMLTNLIMIPFDNALQCYANSKGYVYTRYADDILISAKESFSYPTVVSMIGRILTQLDYPFIIKEEKTRYGSAADRNWNLGLMLNKDNQITLGHKQKMRTKAALNNFFNDFTKGIFWSIMDVYQLQGQLSYFEMIEPDYKQFVVSRLEQKYNLNFRTCVKQILSN